MPEGYPKRPLHAPDPGTATARRRRTRSPHPTPPRRFSNLLSLRVRDDRHLRVAPDGMSWLGLGTAAVLQLAAGVVRVRAWFHVIRHSWPGVSDLRYRDVVTAHLAGVGWNAVLPAHTGDAAKVVIVNRRMPERRLALLAASLAPVGLVEAAFTVLLVVGLVAAGVVSVDILTPTLPRGAGVLVLVAIACLALAAALVLRVRIRRFASDVRAGLAVLGRPRILCLCVAPWLLAGRGLRLLAFACVLPAAGLPFALAPALALMALQGATPSAGAAATAARIALLAAVLAGTGASGVSAAHVAAALATAYAVTSAANLAVSVSVIAWLLRTKSPRRILAYVRSSISNVKSGAPAPAAAPSRVR